MRGKSQLTQTPKQSPKIFCKGCIYYQKREIFAQLLERWYGEAGIWDYATCYNSCIKQNKFK